MSIQQISNTDFTESNTEGLRYVNPKQFNRILERRKERKKFEKKREKEYQQRKRKSKKPNESRRKNAFKRKRGNNGRFLPIKCKTKNDQDIKNEK
ncbi:nuclear transcription factor y subunit alpha [Anaeramoeba flamelloides]|uniref:Nuclear transcription factor Y subunit n=1 Tax=Anaeramoeba flamelloides TaxID=1746091 RepID=A0AAV7YDN0_9EUKA|nr:nuclear transcription factor y subunit alpha [Anaeramoeba flamelloides]KAJ6236806.1 nuclear transcription factor y subunit alpha [Anaeramoeba flamelloides]